MVAAQGGHTLDTVVGSGRVLCSNGVRHSGQQCAKDEKPKHWYTENIIQMAVAVGVGSIPIAPLPFIH